MNEIAAASWLADFKAHPLALGILCITVIAVATLVAVVWMHKSHPEFIKELFKKHSPLSGQPKSLGFVSDIESKLDYVITKIDGLEKEVKELRSQAKDAAISIGMVAIYTRHMPLWDRLLEGLKYFANDGNGNGREEIVGAIMAGGKESVQLWKSAVNYYLKKNGQEQSRVFWDSIEFVNKRIM